MFHGHSYRKCKVSMEKKYIEVCFSPFLSINLKWVTCMLPGPEAHKRTWCSTLNVITKKEKIKKCKYSMVELMESNSQNIYTHVKLFS